MTSRHLQVGITFIALCAALPACGGSSSATPDGGGGGTGGGSGKDPRCLTNMDDLIADFAVDNGLYPVDGRLGGFYTYGDDSKTANPPAVLTPPEGGPNKIDADNGNDLCSGPGSFHVKATGFKIWGAATGVNLVKSYTSTTGTCIVDATCKGWYDASKYKGISFWVKATSEVTGVQVSFPDVYTDGYANAKDADPTVTDVCAYGPAAINCSPYLVKLGSDVFPAYKDMKFDTTWRQFNIMFADTQQDMDNKPGYLLPAIGHLDLQHLTAFAVQVNAIHNDDMTVTANDFEIWLDDIAFIK
jgi:hypothetical protein